MCVPIYSFRKNLKEDLGNLYKICKMELMLHQIYAHSSTAKLLGNSCSQGVQFAASLGPRWSMCDSHQRNATPDHGD